MSRKSAASRSKNRPPALPESAAAVAQPDATIPPQIPSETDAPASAGPTDYSKLPFFDHPAFQEIYAEWRDRGLAIRELVSIFAAGRYSIKDAETLKLVHEDAFTLYDVANGKKPASELLAAFRTHTRPEIFRAIVVDLSEALAPHLEEFLRELASVGPHDEAMLKVLGRLARLREITTAGAPSA
jgi:hypothetical protein